MSKKLPTNIRKLQIAVLTAGGLNLEKVVNRESGEQVNRPNQRWSITVGRKGLRVGYYDTGTGHYEFHTYLDAEEIPYIMYVRDDLEFLNIH